MTSSNMRPFVHRRNTNRTVDSICTKCVATIARREKEDDLTGPEAAHRCDAHLVEARQRWVQAWMSGRYVPSDAPRRQ
jgi:hypothetical protein